MPRITDRDELMLAWLDQVRLADLATIRVALTAFGHGENVVGLRRAQRWVLRMTRIGVLDRTDPVYPGGPVHWVSSGYFGHRAPNPFQQTARHSVAIAAVSARFLIQGYSWQRDSAEWSQYLADGVAVRPGARVLVEVELTQKMSIRYSAILGSHARRLASGEFTEVTYFGPARVMKAIRREIGQRVFRDQIGLMSVHPVLDHLGRWDDGSLGSLPQRATTQPKTVARMPELEVARGKH